MDATRHSTPTEIKSAKRPVTSHLRKSRVFRSTNGCAQTSCGPPAFYIPTSVGFFVGDSQIRRIPLTQGQFAIIDSEDYEQLCKHKWRAQKSYNNYYAVRGKRDKKGKQHTILMHREILNTPKGMETDHKNHNGLDNRRVNLRICTHMQNLQNQRPIHKTSKYKGVWWSKTQKKWQAKIVYKKKSLHLGYFSDEVEAAKTYDSKARELFGEFASSHGRNDNIGKIACQV